MVTTQFQQTISRITKIVSSKVDVSFETTNWVRRWL